MASDSLIRGRLSWPLVTALTAVGTAVGGLLVGYGPIGGDPSRLYEPIKSELARALREGRLPFWSDRFGLGLPLVAESHVAAFFPPNWLLYRLLDVATAYHLAMWLSYLACVAATYLYARRLGLTAWGAAIAGLAFTLSGFQNIHSSHEPFYSSLPLMVLALYFTERYVADGRMAWLASLALTWGAQLTLGHFQLQLWTAGLVLVTGVWRIAQTRAHARAFGLVGALACGAGMAAVQLVLSWDYAQLVGSTSRSAQDLMFYAYPPAHWAELAIPRLFQGLQGGPEAPYWFARGSTGYEACLYVGTIPLVLAFVGAATRRDDALAPWKPLILASVSLATMPQWWPAAYAALLHVPGLGTFRAPGRYTLITTLGLALLAGRGCDRTLSTRRFASGLTTAIAFAVAAAAWAFHWAQRPDYRAALGDDDIARVLGMAAIAWVVSITVIVAWRLRVTNAATVFLLAAAELGVLYYHGTTHWGRSLALPEQSPVLQRLAQELNVGTVAGPLDDLPVRANQSPSYPYTGMRLPWPNSALEFARDRVVSSDPSGARLLRYFGVTHGIWDGPQPGAEVIYAGADEALDTLVNRPKNAPAHVTWYLVRYPGVTASARVAIRAADAPDVRSVLAQLAQTDAADVAWFLPGDRPADVPGPRARVARIVRWDGMRADVEHDGACDLVIRRTYAPGWTARINGAASVPVVPVNAGLQSIRLPGAGPTSVVLEYRPPNLGPAAAVSLTSVGVALLALGISLRRAAMARPGESGTRAKDGASNASGHPRD